MSVQRVAVAGASGRMGRMLIEAILASKEVALHAALDAPGVPGLGEDAAAFLGRPCGVTVQSDLSALAGADVLIDFTRPEATLKHLAAARTQRCKLVIGTTGFDAAGKAAIADAAKEIAIVFAPNMSIGVNVTLKLLEMAAQTLSSGYDVEIVEAHHRNKVDAPSGTALAMGESVARGLKRDHDAVAVFDRHGETGVRRDESIGYAVVRGGDVVGDHKVMFMGQGERIEISHKASSRLTYVHGSLRACRFLTNKPHGLFNMQDVLGLSA